VFFINIPIGVLSIVMAVFVVTDPHYVRGTKMKIDYWGLLLLAAGVGCLQLLLDRGQRYDWFGSNLMVALGLIAAFSLSLFILVELRAEKPIVDLGAFRSPSFCLGNLAMFVFMANLFGTLVLLPIYLQTLMGYTALLAGVVLAPGGVANLLTMPVVGRFLHRYNPKNFVLVGIFFTAYSTYLMSRFSLGVDFGTVLWPRIFMGIGMGMLFIPLTTMVTRRAQFHQSRLVDSLTPYDPVYLLRAGQGAGMLQQKGLDPHSAQHGALGVIYENTVRQASMLAFADVFYILTLMMVILVPVVIIMKNTGNNEGPAPTGE